MELAKVLAPVSEHLDNFEIEYKRALETDSVIIKEITEHLYGGPGKRLRPALIFMTAGVYNDASIYSALAVEFIHTATLLHDDVVDESRSRRGIETVNHKWNNLVSVLMGDYFFAKAFNMLVKAGSPEIMASFARATERVSVGELNQVFYTGNFDITEERYLNIIADKTASLFACSAEAGALCAGINGGIREGLKKYGEKVGMAFQITDDLLDLIGETKKTGKTLGSDIREGWVTLPLIQALKNDYGRSRERIKGVIGNEVGQSGIREVVDFVKNNGGIEYAEQKARGYVQDAVDILHSLDGLPMKNVLEEFAVLAAARDM
ncbi:MAG: polyprenyl synthetase family protein [Candidatus Zixiibacteriota bacterium]|nr:MAG: polyprenyl synthetase family protein [candidate division Zixibacteria bacterium]